MKHNYVIFIYVMLIILNLLALCGCYELISVFREKKVELIKVQYKNK